MSLSDCSYWEYQISLAMDGELGHGNNDELTRHLGECPHCRSVKDAFEKSAQAIRSLPDLADADLLAGLKQDILKKAYRAKSRPTRWVWPAAAILAVFAAANIWLGPLWQRPALLAAAVAPGNRLELTFNQPMNGASWATGVTSGTSAPENTPLAGANIPSPIAGTAKSLSRPQNAPQEPYSPTTKNGPSFGTLKTYTAPAPEPAPPYTVNRQGNKLVVSFAGPLPQGPVQILVPATLRDRWGRELSRTYLVVINHGKITVKTP